MLANLDIAIFHWINRFFVFSWLDPVMVYITDLNHFQWWLIIGLLSFILFGKRRERLSMFLIIIAVIFSDILGNFLKHLFVRMRPEHILENVRLLIESTSSYSLPSNHAMNTAAAATVLVLRYPKKKIIGYCAIVISFLVSYSRVYVGVHYPSDIISGWLFGIGCAWITVQIFKKWDWKSGLDTKTIFGINYEYV
jgi:undecaprenyl-diphosphatase